MNFKTKSNLFLNYLKENTMAIYDDINIQTPLERITFTLIPDDLDVKDIPKVKKICKSVGFICLNHFKQDFDYTKGYRDYHECMLINNGNFMKEINIEELL